MTVTLSRKAILALDMHRLAELDERIRKMALEHMKLERELLKAVKEREALRMLVSQ